MQTAELVRTVELIVEHGVKGAAMVLGITAQASTYRVRRLEKQLGFRLFSSYDYDRVTYRGREYLRMANDDQ
jgi:DNA-binding transcriptional LysR family regulator